MTRARVASTASSVCIRMHYSITGTQQRKKKRVSSIGLKQQKAFSSQQSNDVRDLTLRLRVCMHRVRSALCPCISLMLSLLLMLLVLMMLQML